MYNYKYKYDFVLEIPKGLAEKLGSVIHKHCLLEAVRGIPVSLVPAEVDTRKRGQIATTPAHVRLVWY